MKIRRPWTTKHWCESVIAPEWPFAYSKYKGQIEEFKGRVSSNKQDVRHRCETQGVQSKCHICEEIRCGGGNDTTTKSSSLEEETVCHFQLQGVSWDEMSKNIPTVTDVPWAVGGAHRYDYGGENTTHVCMYMSGREPCQSHLGTDYSACVVRCWGHHSSKLSGLNNTSGPTSKVQFDDDDDDSRVGEDGGKDFNLGIWPNLKVAERQEGGLNTTPWTLPQPTAMWSYPKSDMVGNDFTYNIGPELELLPQGFTFTLAGSESGEEGFEDGKGPRARFRYPEGVAVNHQGYVFVADTGNHAIRMITPSGSVTTIAGNGHPGFGDGSNSTEVQFSSPSGIGIWQNHTRSDESIVLFVVDTGNHRIRKVIGHLVYNEETKERTMVNITTECFCGNCGKSPQAGYANGNGTQSRFDNPVGITIGGSGNMYVTDTNNHLIRWIDPFGQVRTLAGKLRIAELNRYGERLEGCPDPCLTGSQGHEDGDLSDAKFSFPLGIALSSDESYLLITSRHYLRRINLADGLVVTTNGNNRESEVDGQGQEASFNKPHGITITKDGFAFIVDSASCRIRRAATPTLIARNLGCMDTLDHVFRPPGCFSYNAKIDQHGLKASSRAGFIQYNYKYRNWTSKDLGKDFVGRSSKNCIGSPPNDTLDKKSWNDRSLVIDDGRFHIREDPNEGSLIQASCPTTCNYTNSSNLVVYGRRVEKEGQLMQMYTAESPICFAAAHVGLLNSTKQEIFLDIIIHRANDLHKTEGRFIYNISVNREKEILSIPQTRSFYSLQSSTSNFVIQTISGQPSAKRGDFCGYENSIPAQDAKFNIPTSIAAFVNDTLNDKNNFLYIADRDNHVVRAMSATCSFVCENGGRCVGTDKCSCSSGWSGVDCSIPNCLKKCNERQVCVGPNQCDCIPGFRGENCSEPTCVQKCEHGGSCTAPDTCSCLPGWFDSNCTTPVCNQTCGNGGNCTAPNMCSCPTDWSGADCREPVCQQTCLNGGICIAPNTCVCPPAWSGYDCSEPTCHQGFFKPYDAKLVAKEKLTWMEYVPCNIQKWCNTTNSFDCSQKMREFTQTLPLYGAEWRFKTGIREKPQACFMIELRVDAISPFQYIQSFNNEPSTYQRYTNITPNDWFSKPPKQWNAHIVPNENHTRPWSYTKDRQVALVEARYVTQGNYKCANNGECVAPDTCACSDGWIGFDCRVPICDQGYYEENQKKFIKSINNEKELEKFRSFLHASHTYLMNPKNGGYSNPHYRVIEEFFKNYSFVERIEITTGGKRYLQMDGNGQGGYECSVRSVTEWEDYRSGAIFEHPNYYSRYMDRKVERDGKMYTHWEEMGWDPLFEKTNVFQLNAKSFEKSDDNTEFIYTDKGYKRDGYWLKTNFSWTKGYCIIEFERICDDPSKQRDLQGVTSEKSSSVVQDTDLSFRPRISYDNDRAYMSGEWRIEGGECVDQVIRGCFNNGTCVGPNQCKCSEGWTGYDCTEPICHQHCKHNGNCTLPNTCTCEKGWTGIDCSEPLCAQNCNNGGKCVAPDTCKCKQWENTWRDGRFHGGVPLYQTPKGDPQMTGWTGYDCSTPICVQAERFIPNVKTSSYQWSELVPLGGHGKDGKLRCDKVECPEYDQIVTMNNGESFQSGCGFDPIDTGCCYAMEKDDGEIEYSCFKCNSTYKEYSVDSFSCPMEGRLQYKFKSSLEVSRDFRDTRSKEVNLCGPNHDPMPINGANHTSQRFLCERYEWEQGDYIDDAGLNKESGIGASNGLLSGRHIRVNYKNYVRDENDLYNWTEKRAIPGEGVFACYNEGSCIKPDICTCRDGYAGFDCKTPLCRHQQMDGKVVGCLNDGQCIEKDNCKCKQEQSILWMQYETAERGTTGWGGSDCSMPICSQGYYDPDCVDNPFAVGGEGCYRCQNDGLCIAPDVCKCAEGWTGFDCKTPVCKISATPLIKQQLMTVDKHKIKLFENDPCGMKDFHSGNLFKSRDYRGFCALPNQCTCHCKSSHDAELCKAFGGRHCILPFQDRLHRFRNVLAPNQIFGTRSCYSGYEGAVDENDKFISCHLDIYEPSYLVEKSISLLFWGTFLFLFGVISFCHYRIKLQRKNLEDKVEKRKLRRGAMMPSNFDAFSSYHDIGAGKDD